MNNVYGSWRGKPTTRPTDEECVRSCLENAEHAARDEAATRDLLGRLPPGDTRRPQARQDLMRHVSDQPHWRSVAAFYRARIAAKRPALTSVPPEPDRRLPREPGDDTEEMAF